MTIRSFVCRIEDHTGARLPTNHICVWSQMTSQLSRCSVKTASHSVAYFESLHLRTLARQALVLSQSLSRDTCGPQDENLRSPSSMASAFPFPYSPTVYPHPTSCWTIPPHFCSCVSHFMCRSVRAGMHTSIESCVDPYSGRNELAFKDSKRNQTTLRCCLSPSLFPSPPRHVEASEF